MSFQISRRDLLRAGVGTAVALNAFGGSGAFAQSVPVRSVPKDYKEDLFYREDWLGEPWRKPDTAVLIHGNDESSIEWYAWVPRMAQDYRLIRPDLPGLGHSKIPPGFEYSLASLATFVTQVMDRAGSNPRTSSVRRPGQAWPCGSRQTIRGERAHLSWPAVPWCRSTSRTPPLFPSATG